MTRRANSCAGDAGSVVGRMIFGSANVPQWIGITIAGSMSATTAAARSRIQVSRADPSPPPPDRKQRHVDRAPKLGHVVEQIGVAGEVDRSGAADEKADRRRRGSERPAAAIVHGGNRPHRHGAHADLVVCRHLGDGVPVRAPPATARADAGAMIGPDRRTARSVATSVWSACRWDRSTQSTSPTSSARDRRRDPHDRPDPRAQHGVGQEPYAVELHEHGGVTEPDDRADPR